MPVFPLGTTGASRLGRYTLRASSRAAMYSCVGLWAFNGDQAGKAVSTNAGTPTTLDLSGRAHHLQFYASTGPGTPTMNWAGEAVAFDGTQLNYGIGFDSLKPASDASGHVPATIMCVTRPTTNPGSDLCIFQIGSTTALAAPRWGLFRSSSQSFFAQIIGAENYPTNAATISLTGFPAGDIYCLVATSRSKTEHQLVVCNLRTGAVSSGTSTTDIGSAAVNPTWVSAAAYLYGGDYNLPQLRYSGEINLTAAMARGLSADEMYALARAPFSLLEAAPVVPLSAFYVPPPAPASARSRPRIISSAWWPAA
jgi:hypothetical protein